jgi:hypothetical protein
MAIFLTLFFFFNLSVIPYFVDESFLNFIVKYIRSYRKADRYQFQNIGYFIYKVYSNHRSHYCSIKVTNYCGFGGRAPWHPNRVCLDQIKFEDFIDLNTSHIKVFVFGNMTSLDKDTQSNYTSRYCHFEFY